MVRNLCAAWRLRQPVHRLLTGSLLRDSANA